VVVVQLFGAFEVMVNSRRLGPRDFGGVKPKQLLETLLVQRGHALAKDQLAEMIWGGAPPRKVAATVESYVSLLRSRLGAASGLIATETGGYRADLGGVQLDVDIFDRLLRDAAGAPPEERRPQLEAALAIASAELRLLVLPCGGGGWRRGCRRRRTAGTSTASWPPSGRIASGMKAPWMSRTGSP
jgi:DNA-binding SARP family transcriptional activator